MMKPEVTMCPDGHFRRVIYTLGPYIADYPEQVLLTGIVAGWCPKYVYLCRDPYSFSYGVGVRRVHQTLMPHLHFPARKHGQTSWLRISRRKSCGMIAG